MPTAVDSTCEAAWLAAAMTMAGAPVGPLRACSARPGFRIAMRLSRLGSAVAFDVEVCGAHQRVLRHSPHFAGSTALPGATR